jgi:hypothetical protein
MIHITAAEGKYYFSDVVILTSRQSMNIDEQTLTLDQLEGLKDGYETGRLIMTSGDYTKLLTTIETAPYPSLTGNANKVLAVKATEDDIEWTTALTQVYVDTQDNLLRDQIDLKADAIAVNQSLGTKADLINGLIPAPQLPSYVDDVLSFLNLASFPLVGEDGKIYIAEDINKTYRWGGSSYVEIGGGGVAIGETSSTAYRGDRGKIAYDHSLSQGNPHNTTTSEIAEGTNKYFTESRVNQTVLTGLNTNTATPALATDNLLAAIGKLQAQISNSSSGSSGFNWVNADQISGFTMDSPVQYHSLKFAKKDGILWVCGSLRARGATNASTKFFNISNSAYMVEQHVTNFFGAASQVAVCNITAHPITIGSPPSNASALAMFYVLNTNLYLRTSYVFSTDGGFIAFNPTPIGRLLN